MKKNLMIFAASTMLLFAACNKEDNDVYTINGDKITFGISMDEPQSADKQTYVGTTNRIWFDAGDQIYVNHEVCAVNPQSVAGSSATSSSLSYVGKVTATVSGTGRYDFVYPAASLQYDGTNYTGTFPAAVQAINSAVDNHLDASFPRFSNCQTPLWPMYYGISDISTQTNTIKLKNACSFIAPSFQYGAAFANAVFAPLVAQGTEYGVNAVPPSLNYMEGKIKSTIPLHGPAHLDYTDLQNPVMVMDATMPTAGFQILHIQGPRNAQVVYNPNRQDWNIAGVVPVAPVTNVDMTIRMASSFWVNLGTDNDPLYYYMVYVTDEKTLEGASLLRNTIHELKVNFNTIGDQNDEWYTVTDNTTFDTPRTVYRIAGGWLFLTQDLNEATYWTYHYRYLGADGQYHLFDLSE
jgi:hypothetical protein